MVLSLLLLLLLLFILCKTPVNWVLFQNIEKLKVTSLAFLSIYGWFFKENKGHEQNIFYYDRFINFSTFWVLAFLWSKEYWCQNVLLVNWVATKAINQMICWCGFILSQHVLLSWPLERFCIYISLL